MKRGDSTLFNTRKAHIRHEAHGLGPPASVIQQRLAMAYANFKRLKVQNDQKDTWIRELIAVQAEARGCWRIQLRKKVRATEHIRKVTRMVKCILQPTEQRRGLAQVTETGDGRQVDMTHTTKLQVEQACL